MVTGWRQPSSIEEDEYIRGVLIGEGTNLKKTRDIAIVSEIAVFIILIILTIINANRIVAEAQRNGFNFLQILASITMIIGLGGIFTGFVLEILSQIKDKLPECLIAKGEIGDYDLLDVNIDYHILNDETKTYVAVFDKYECRFWYTDAKNCTCNEIMHLSYDERNTDGLLICIKDDNDKILDVFVIPEYDYESQFCQMGLDNYRRKRFL